MTRIGIQWTVMTLCYSLLLCACISAVDAAEPKKGGPGQSAKAPSAEKQDPRSQQYKRRNREQISAIVSGKAEAVIEQLKEHLAGHPDDLESRYTLTVAYCQTNDPAGAVECMSKALEAGLPLERFVAGPRGLLEPLTETDQFRELARKRGVGLVHGPMVGCVTDSSAKLWLRTADEVSVQAVLSESEEMSRPIRSATVFTDADRDYTAVAEVERLKPDTVYHYDLLVNGKPVLGAKLPSFRTFPPAESAARFQVGFGGGAGYTPWKERMWDTIASKSPLAFLFLGDNVYIDTPTKPEVQQYCYYRRQSRPEYRRFVSTTSIFAIWDDHDFGTNDCWYGPAVNDPPFKIPVWEVFRQNWNNPGYGGGRRRPGCWFRFGIADVDFFMLDGRYYRTNPKIERPSMLGPVQREWLLDGLKHSEAAFKVLASPVPWSLEAKGKSLDTWRGFQAEREEIFSFLDENRIDGVILLSADRHRSDAWRIDRDDGYPLYEFESSRLTNVHRHTLMHGALFGYNEKCSFGLLTFDTTKPDPEVAYQIINIDGELVHTFTAKLSQISHK